MFLYTLPPEGLVFPEATGEDWARHDALTFAAAAERARDKTPAEDAAP